MISSAECAPIVGSASWELPDFKVVVHADRKHPHALVIPVINEGERIRAQLLLIRDSKLPVDVIVADGGSMDGSLDPAFTAGAGTRAVLTKTGPGKLSAQLRMAYAWCLREGYDGIVTVDGNGKDGVEAVADMVTELQKGYDYVQGSRYLPGGVAENTPLERTIANRAIHAPLLSLAGKYWFTDTTNGFRAYSARYLLDPRVQPFRDVFQRYELLFYLTVRAGQIGMKVGQIPVARRYPTDGKVPTKITGVSSKLKLLGEAVSAATGGYTPDSPGPSNPRWLWLIFLLSLVTLPLLYASLTLPKFSPDSWAYYELGKTVFADFYRFAHHRTYWTSTPYSTSFPPLFPALIAVVDVLVDTGARTGLYITFFSFLLFAILSEHIGRRAFGVAWLGLGMALLLLLGPEMLLDEMSAGRTIPLQLVFFALLLLYLVDFNREKVYSAIVVGVLSGLAALNRFDAILVPFLASAAIWLLTRRLAFALLAVATSAVVISPWIVYSLTTFGIPFATDNSSVAKAVSPSAFVTDWWPVAQPTLFDNPSAWFERVSSNFVELFKSFVRAGMNRMGLVFLLTLTSLGIVRYFSVTRQAKPRVDWKSLGAPHVVALFVAIAALLLLPQLLTGYLEARYFTLLYWGCFLLFAGWMVQAGKTAHQRQVFARIAFVMIFVPVVAFSGLVLARAASSGQLDIVRWSEFDAPADAFSLGKCIRDDTKARILVLGNDSVAARIGALTGLHTMLEPRNMVDGRLGAEGSRNFLAVWNVSYVLVARPVRLDFANTTFKLERVPNCPLALFRVTR